MVLEGVYYSDKEQRIRFQRLPPPDDAEVKRVTARIARRIFRLMERRGLGPCADPDEADPLFRDQPLLAELYGASVQGRVATGPRAGNRITVLGAKIESDDSDIRATPRCAVVSGVSLHANVCIPAKARRQLENLQPDYTQAGTERVALNQDCDRGTSMARRRRSSAAELRR